MLGLNEAQIILVCLGMFMELLGTVLVLSGRGSESSGANALNRINLNVPAWLMVVILGVALIFASLTWNWADGSSGGADTEPPVVNDDGFFDGFSDSFDFGDDAFFDGLWLDCADGFPSACDELYMVTPVGSIYEDFAATCGWRLAVWDANGCWAYDFSNG